jgi:phosphomannomutase
MIALFDMDGTLTPPREQITKNVVEALKRLAAFCKIGIISGSDRDYIMQQCESMFDMGGVPINSVDILPCNGTKLLRWEGSRFHLLHEADMLAEIGDRSYKKIMRWLFNHQAEISTLYPDINFTGTFFQYRGSLLNWCPIGRVADLTLRDDWKKWDQSWQIRETYMEELQKYLKVENIAVTVALGGTTSFDIYPNGWDKTYGLKHYTDEKVFFVGDKCQLGGNDWHLYSALQGLQRAWETNGPEDTIHIIDRIIEKISSP